METGSGHKLGGIQKGRPESEHEEEGKQQTGRGRETNADVRKMYAILKFYPKFHEIDSKNNVSVSSDTCGRGRWEGGG